MVKDVSRKDDMDDIYGWMPIVGPVLLVKRMIDRRFGGKYSSDKSFSEIGDNIYRNNFLDGVVSYKNNFFKKEKEHRDNFLSEAQSYRSRFLASVA